MSSAAASSLLSSLRIAVELTTNSGENTENLAYRRSRGRDARHVGSMRVMLRRMRPLTLTTALLVLGCNEAAPPPIDFAAQRERMIKEQIVMRGVLDERVLAAMRKVPREQFVPEDVRADSYKDGPLPIGYDQTISQPYIVALMTEQLRPQSTDHVLEIGTGSGYQAAILAEFVAEVYSIELVEPLAVRAQATLQRLGYKNVDVKAGDGYKGWPE